MVVSVFAILDIKSAAYGVPFFSVTRGSAIRALMHQLSQDAQNMMALYPHDFVLYDLGTYDDVTGQIAPLTVPVMIISIGDMLISAKGDLNEQ